MRLPFLSVAFLGLLSVVVYGRPRGAWELADAASSNKAWFPLEDSGNNTDIVSGIVVSTTGTVGRVDGKIGYGQYVSSQGNHQTSTPSGPNISSGNLTIMGWIASGVNTNTTSIFMSRRYSVGGGGDRINYQLVIDEPSDPVKFSFTTGSGNPGYCQYSISTNGTALGIHDGNWHHLAFTFTYGNSNSAAFYLDGVRKTGSWTYTEASPNLPHVNSENEKLFIGGEPGLSFKKTYDDIRIYNYYMSEDQIRAIYNSGR